MWRPSLLAALSAVFVCGLAGAAAPRWKRGEPLPRPRSEVAAAVAGGLVYVVGGFTAEGQGSPRVDLYDPRADRWLLVRDLPIAAHHPMAAGDSGRLYVVGGYGIDGALLKTAYSYEHGVWTRLPDMPEPRAAGGAAFVKGKLYVVGGVVRTESPRLARTSLRYDPRARRWSTVPGPTPREHLGVTSFHGRLYAVGGRKLGWDTNLALFESYQPGARRWRRLRPVPGKRGGTGAAATGRWIVSVGGEQPSGTIRTVFAYDLRTQRWRRLPNLPTPRHGLGVVAALSRVYVIGGGKQPGLAGVSGANEFLTLR